MKTKDFLLDAARHIEMHGLLKGGFGSAHGPCCIRGAINLVTIGSTVDGDYGNFPADDMRQWFASSAVDAIARQIGAKDDRYWARAEAVANWNDAPDRTRSEVLAAMRKAAEACV